MKLPTNGDGKPVVANTNAPFGDILAKADANKPLEPALPQLDMANVISSVLLAPLPLEVRAVALEGIAQEIQKNKFSPFIQKNTDANLTTVALQYQKQPTPAQTNAATLKPAGTAPKAPTF